MIMAIRATPCFTAIGPMTGKRSSVRCQNALPFSVRSRIAANATSKPTTAIAISQP